MTLTQAIYDYAVELERAAEYPIAGRLRDLAREFGDTEEPEPDGEPMILPPIGHPGPLPRIEET